MNAKLSLVSVALLIQARAIFGQPQPGTQLWLYGADSTIVSSPAVGPDGTVYVGTALGLSAITNGGSNRWTFSVSPKGSPAVGSDGTIYFVNTTGNLYAVNSDGSQKWVYQSLSLAWSSPALASDGTIYFAASGQLFAVSPDGTNRWSYAFDSSSTPGHALSPAIAPDGTIYVGAAYNRALFAINPDGTQKWTLSLDGVTGESTAIAADGTIYLTTIHLNAVSPYGTNIWENTIPAESSPVIAKDGTIYVENPIDTSLWSIKPNGQTNWSAIPTSVFHPPPPTTPAIDAGGTVYYCNSNSVYALNPQGQVRWVFAVPYGSGMSVPPSTISPAIGPDGTIYAAFAGTLYAIAGTNALGNTPWPMYRQNLRHTGKLEKPSLNQPKKRADAGFEFEMFGEVGQPYTIQSSTNLASWALLTNFIASTQTTSVVDFTASNSPSRFYRALIQ